MADSYGDGWNGATVNIIVNGVIALEGATITGGSSGSETFEAATGDTIELDWTNTGSWPSEISWTIDDGEGTQISSGNTSNTNGGTAFCPPPPTPCSHTFNMADSYGDGWNGATVNIIVNGVIALEGATITGGSSGSETFEAATGDTIELDWTNTGSWPSEISWTIDDGEGTQISSGNTSNTNGGTGNCPDCLPPSGLTLDSVSTTGAVVSWTGGDATSWEYELVIAGETPTGVGIATTTNPLTITGCYSNTAYDLYIRTDCGGVYSSWVAMSFTTSPACGDTIYDTGGANDNYSNNELITVTVFPENPGDVVTFTFLSFNTESCCDDLTVYDGPDTTSTVVGTYAGTAIPDPIISTHISGALTFVFNSDSSVTRDGYEILVTCAPPPTCSAPTGLAISNIGGTTADFDWNAFDGNQSWEYVVVPTGDPAPTASGTFSAINSTTLTDLEFLTTYDVYVRAFCGEEDGYSVWSGPVTFTTTQQTDYTIDCSLGEPVNINYCYTNNDTTYWLFTSTDGFPLKIEFNAGTIEGFWDDLTIYDGPDNTFPVLFNNNDADIEDFTDLVVESTSTAVYVEVDSDTSSGSCESSFGYTPWDFDVSCKTCITQTVEFSIDGACEPIQEFYINANITDMGDAMNLELTDNQGSSAQTTTQTGIVTFGPYPVNEQVVITVVNSDDTSCSVESDVLTFLCPPPPNDCSIVYAGEDTSFCSDGSTPVTLTASYHLFGQDTTSYDVTVQENCPAPNLTGGTPTSINTDDVWSEVIDLGFEFCFFGETYSQILVGSNGMLSFELDNAETGNGWDLQSWTSTSPDTLPNSSNPTISEANIFGVGHDIDPSECGEINYMILGSAPARQFVVNYNEVCHFGLSCSDYTSTSQIILYESSNVIDVNIIDKPLCTEWNDGLAVVGIQNIDDTIAFVAPDRNTSDWETSNEFWRFSPSVGEANYNFGWYDGDTLISNEDTISVSPEQTTTYTAAVTYNLCNGDTATVSDAVVVEIAPTPVPVPVDDEIQGCVNEDLVLEVNVDPSQESPSLVYYWSYNNEDVQIGTDNTYTIPAYSDQYGEYTVTAYNEDTGCFSSTTIFASTYLNQNCVDIPQGISPNGDGYNDCLILDHLEAQEDIIKAEIYNRYGVKVFELNDYVDHWCGQDASDGNLDSDELLPVGTYFYVIQYASEREPTISWIYLNY
jgi:gliding motility-associated-like protein